MCKIGTPCTYMQVQTISICKFDVNLLHQHGFVKDNNIETAIFVLIDEVVNSLDKQKISLSFYLDLSEAFDCV